MKQELIDNSEVVLAINEWVDGLKVHPGNLAAMFDGESRLLPDNVPEVYYYSSRYEPDTPTSSFARAFAKGISARREREEREMLEREHVDEIDVSQLSEAEKSALLSDWFEKVDARVALNLSLLL